MFQRQQDDEENKPSNALIPDLQALVIDYINKDEKAEPAVYPLENAAKMEKISCLAVQKAKDCYLQNEYFESNVPGTFNQRPRDSTYLCRHCGYTACYCAALTTSAVVCVSLSTVGLFADGCTAVKRKIAEYKNEKTANFFLDMDNLDSVLKAKSKKGIISNFFLEMDKLDSVKLNDGPPKAEMI